MPPVTTALIAANVVLFLLETAAPALLGALALWPLGASKFGAAVGFQPWRLISYAFLHASLVHLAFNMFVLYMLGHSMERVFGGRRVLLYYLVVCLSPAIAHLQ